MSAVASSAEFSSADSGQGESPGDVCSLAPTDAADKAREAVDRATKREGLSQITCPESGFFKMAQASLKCLFTLKLFSEISSIDSITNVLECLFALNNFPRNGLPSMALTLVGGVGNCRL